MNHTTERFARFSRYTRAHTHYGDPIEHYRRPRFYTVHAVGYLLTLAIAIACTLVLIVNLKG